MNWDTYSIVVFSFLISLVSNFSILLVISKIGSLLLTPSSCGLGFSHPLCLHSDA